MSTPPHVVAGVLRDARGRVLLAERPPGKQHAGLWEFPGGKVEDDEAPVDALARELREELGIVVESARPLITIPPQSPARAIRLDVWDVTAWSGRLAAHDGQRLAWVEPTALDALPMPPADRPVLAALRLPDLYLITPPVAPDEASRVLDGIARACARGISLIRLRQPQWPRALVADIARAARDTCRAHGARLLLSDALLAGVLGLGVHLSARDAANALRRSLPASLLLGVSCHDRAELAQAERMGADFVTLSPLFETPGHPGTPPLGWDGFAELAAATALPAFALGGLEADDLDAARMAGGQGIAAIRGLWPG